MTQIEQISCSPSLAWPPGELNQYHPSNLLTKRDSVELLIISVVPFVKKKKLPQFLKFFLFVTIL